MIQEAFSSYLPIAVHALVRGGVIFIIALSVVYVFGRMLGLVQNYRSKNLLALMVIFPSSYASVVIYDQEILINSEELFWRAAVYGAIAILFYVLVGFDLYDRFNGLCDKRLGKPDKKPSRKYRDK